MRQFVRSVAALGIFCAAGALAVAPGDGALAQDKQAPPSEQQLAVKQMALTEKQIQGVLGAQKDMESITEKMPDDAKPDPKIVAQLDAVAKKYGFASYEEYNNVIDNIGMVMAGFDPATKKFVGVDGVIKAQIAQIQADKKMSAKDKKDALAELNGALKSPPPTIENKGNIDLVAKYYDQLSDVLGSNDD